MTLAIPSQIYILYQFLTRVMMKCDMTYVAYRDSFCKDILTWTHYLILPLYQLLLTIWTEQIYDVAIAPIYFWKLCWHPKGKSIWQILSDTGGEDVRIETTVNSDGKESKMTRQRARPQSKMMVCKQKGKPKGINIEVEPIKKYCSDIYMHSYYQSNPASTNQMDVNESAEDNSSSKSLAQAMSMTIHFASTFYSAMYIIFPKPPKEPPDGIITALVMIPITWICILPHFFIACVCIMRHKYKNDKISKWRRKISAAAKVHQNPNKKSRRSVHKFCIKHIAFQISRAQQYKTSASKGVPKADDNIFYASVGSNIRTSLSVPPSEPTTSS